MDKFEKTFEDLDVHTSVMEGAMAGATATTTPASQVFNLFQTPTPMKFQVDDLIKQVAEENGLEVAGQLASVGVPTASLGEATAASTVTFSQLENISNCLTFKLPGAG